MKRVLALCVTILFTLTIAYAGGELRYSESFLSDSRGHLTNITTVKSMNEIFPGAMGDIPGFGCWIPRLALVKSDIRCRGRKNSPSDFTLNISPMPAKREENGDLNHLPNTMAL